MTESMKTAIKAINKWVFFCWNYHTVHHTWEAGDGTIRSAYIPEFLANVDWTCNFDHILKKWRDITNDGNGNSSECVPSFYAELDDSNRELLLEWIMEHYENAAGLQCNENEKCAEAQTLAKIREWAEDYPSYLSNREGYARGYREGVMRCHKYVLSLITGEPFEE